jgi:uncharacterized protein
MFQLEAPKEVYAMERVISTERMDAYKRTAREREESLRQKAAERRKVAWRIAEQAARRLKEDFGATRVIVYGSLAHGAWFNQRSDIDLAVEGIVSEAFWKAWCSLDVLESSFEINLVPMESASPRLHREILDWGVEL